MSSILDRVCERVASEARARAEDRLQRASIPLMAGSKRFVVSLPPDSREAYLAEAEACALKALEDSLVGMVFPDRFFSL